MSAQDLERLRAEVDLAEVIGRYVQLRGRATGELKGPCPMCGGRDRFSVFKDRKGWMCRGCTPESGDVFDFVQKVENCDFKRAVEILGGKILPSKKRPVPHAPARPEPDYRKPEWQAEAKAVIEFDKSALKSSESALQYLESRGINRASQIIWQLGFNAKKRAITVPWLGTDGNPTAVKFRYVKPWSSKDGKLQRFCQIEGGSQIVFGGQFKYDGQPVVLVEGEFNAISIRQACPHTHVLCAGGDTNFRPMVALLTAFPDAAVWMDDIEKLERVEREWGSTIKTKFVSPDGMDANDILTKLGSATLQQIIQSLCGRLH